LGEITEALRLARHERAREEQHRSEVDDAATTAVAPRRPELPLAEKLASTEAAPRPAPPRSDEPTVEISRAKAGEWVARSLLVAHPLAECFRGFAIRVRLATEARPNPMVMVTSAVRREGKTTVACNLALALASMAAERRVALVDLDLHRPGVAAALGILPSVGLERVLEGQASVASARICTDIPALDVFAIGRPRSHAHDIFSSRRFRDVAAELAQGYDAVVIDTPPVLLLPDVALIAPHVGGWIAVVRAGNTPRSAFREMLGALPGDRLIGCFLNEAILSRHARYGYYHGEPDAPAAEGSAAG
jgi:Mrp family chromosome partitioning ATPase